MDRRTVGEQVADHVRQLIFDGELRVGDRIGQDQIAAELGVSRVPIREALIALDHEGWLIIKPHKGAFVVGLNEQAVRDQYDIFGMAYGLAARRAAERADQEELDELKRALQVLLDAKEVDEQAEANIAVLSLILSLAKSPRLASLPRRMSSIVPGNFFQAVPGAIEVQRRGLRKVFAAIRSQNPDGAETEFRDLMQRQGACVVSVLAEKNVFPDPDTSRG